MLNSSLKVDETSYLNIITKTYELGTNGCYSHDELTRFARQNNSSKRAVKIDIEYLKEGIIATYTYVVTRENQLQGHINQIQKRIKEGKPALNNKITAMLKRRGFYDEVIKAVNL